MLRYELLERLGEGGMGDVWSCRIGPSNGVVAVKFVKQRSREADARLVREARLGRRVRHPNVIAIGELVRSHDGVLGLVMEKLEGEVLDSVLFKHGPLPAPFVAYLGTALASALAFTHAAGIVHRDVKPSNVFLLSEKGVVRPKLLDFGIAARLSQAEQAVETIMGTPGYMAPEQCHGPGDARADIWALGVLLYECLTGQRLFDGSSLTAVMRHTLAGPIPHLRTAAPHVPAVVADLVANMLQRDPNSRVSLAVVYDTLARHAAPVSSDALAETVFADAASADVAIGSAA